MKSTIQKFCLIVLLVSSSDLENIYRFYSEEELFEAGTVNFNYVNPVGLKDETLSRITQKISEYID